MTKRQVQDAVYCVPRITVENKIRRSLIPSYRSRAFMMVYEGILFREIFAYGNLERKIKSRLTSIHN